MLRVPEVASLFALPLALVLVSTSARAVTDDESEFLAKAAQGGKAEVEMGRLAEKRAIDPAIQKFARKMVVDHERINKQLLALAKRKGAKVDGKLSAKQQQDYSELKAKSTEDFDQAYMDEMVSDHKDDIALFEDATRNASDHEISDFSSKTLKTLRHHAGMAQQLNRGKPATDRSRGPKS